MSVPSTLAVPSQSPTSAASGISVVGIAVGIAVGTGVGVSDGDAVGVGTGVAVGVGANAGVGIGEGTTVAVGDSVGVGVRTAVGVGGSERGSKGPHALSSTAANPCASMSALRHRASLPICVVVVSRVNSFRVRQPGSSENVTAYESTIAHSRALLGRRQPPQPGF